jgi:hypothetical protein
LAVHIGGHHKLRPHPLAHLPQQLEAIMGLGVPVHNEP